LGGNIKHGEKSTIVVFVKQLMVKDRKNEGETKLVPMLKAYRVFHVSQCEGLPEKVTNPVTKLPRNKHVRDVLVDGFVASTQADVREGHGEPAYHPAGDYVSMPRFVDFKTGDGFYSTLFHELTHWTGHKARCGRDLKSRFGDLHAYAAEELTAEIGASFLAAEFGLDNTKLQHAAYLAGWTKLLKHDRRAFFTAASKAQQAVDYLRSLALADQPIAA
jgi:antirestriction protein ArdC